MMKKRIGALLFALLMLLGVCACGEQTLPGIDVFSPGLVRLSEKMAQNPAVSAQAQVTIGDAFYVRDLSVLANMLQGATFGYEGGENGECLTISHGEKVLGQYALSGDALIINGVSYALDSAQGVLEQMTASEIPGYDEIAEGFAKLADRAILERAPLDAVAAFLESLAPGDSIGFGFSVTEAITLERTMSDDGTRLTRIDFASGALAREGEAPYAITGYMRQPAGRAPKDTFELVIRQDDKNFLELSYSALRENTVTSKNKKGEMSVRTSVKAAGKIGGSSISSRLTVNMTNAWTADGEALNEKVTVSATLTHQDNTPGRRMQRLNQAEVKLRNVIRLTTHDAADAVIDVTDDVTFEAVMDGNTFLTAGMDISMSVGGEAAALPQAQAVGGQPLDAAMREAVRELAKAAYPLLDDKAQEKTVKDL